MDLGVSGLASGFDWRSLVDQLADVERAPERRLQSEQGAINQRNLAYGNLTSELQRLKTTVDALKDPTLFQSHQTSVGDSTLLSASADSSAASGTYTFDITQLATASSQQGTGNIGKSLNTT